MLIQPHSKSNPTCGSAYFPSGCAPRDDYPVLFGGRPNVACQRWGWFCGFPLTRGKTVKMYHSTKRHGTRFSSLAQLPEERTTALAGADARESVAPSLDNGSSIAGGVPSRQSGSHTRPQTAEKGSTHQGSGRSRGRGKCCPLTGQKLNCVSTRLSLFLLELWVTPRRPL